MCRLRCLHTRYAFRATHCLIKRSIDVTAESARDLSTLQTERRRQATTASTTAVSTSFGQQPRELCGNGVFNARSVCLYALIVTKP
eukprot:6214661-Pleurochrysis_carterae.AAC.5